MKTNRQVSTWILALVLSSSSALGWSLQSTPSQDSGAKQDMKDAGHDTKNAVKSAGRGTKQGTKKAYHATKNGTKKAWNKTKSTTKGAVDGGKAGAKEPPQ
jgi:hypothetical protein